MRGRYLEVGDHVGEGGRPAEGEHHALAAPGQDHLGVQALLPEQLELVQRRVKQAARLWQVQLRVLDLQTVLSVLDCALWGRHCQASPCWSYRLV